MNTSLPSRTPPHAASPVAASTMPCSWPPPPNAKPRPSIPGISGIISLSHPASLAASKPPELIPAVLRPTCTRPPCLHYNLVVMKRRKHKPKPDQDAKPAQQDTIHGETQNPANPAEMQVELENSASYIELQSEIESLASEVGAQTEPESPSRPVETPAGSEPPVSSSPAPAGADRRTQPRYTFTAVAEVVAAASGARSKTRVRDLSQQGCYLDTDSPLPLGIAVDVRITKGAKSLEAQARVVYNQPGKGMGLMFTAVEPEHRETLDCRIPRNLLARGQPSQESASPDENPRARLRSGRRRVALGRSDSHAGGQRSWRVDCCFGAALPGTAAHSVEYPDERRARVRGRAR